MNCEFNQNGKCEVSSLLAKYPIAIDEKACAKCIEHDNPRALNPITCGRALYHLRKTKQKMTDEVGLCLSDKSEGVGEELEKIFNNLKWYLGWIGLGGLLTLDPEKCGCYARRKAMNQEGSKEVKKKYKKYSKEIVDKFIELKPYLLIKIIRIPLYFLVQRCILLAIQRNEDRINAGNTANICNQHEKQGG